MPAGLGGLVKLTRWQTIAYAAGSSGWGLADRLLVMWALYYYLPPAGETLPTRLPPGLIFGLIPIWGIISIVGRLVDAVADPVVATQSDRSTHPLGRRRFFMAMGMIPLAASAALIFFPPVDGPSATNAYYVAAVYSVFFIAFTFYVAPYLALLPELGRTKEERLNLTTYQAVALLIGSAIAMLGSPALIKVFEGMGKAGAYKVMAVIMAGIALAFMAWPVLAIPERKIVPKDSKPSTLSLTESLLAILRFAPFKWYLIATILFWFGFNAISTSVPFYAVVLMGADDTFSGTVLLFTFIVSGLSLPVVNWMGKKWGNKKTLMAGALMMAVVLCAVPLITGKLSGIIVFALAGFPVSVLMAVPNALLANIADADGKMTGQRKEAMFFGAQGFFQKIALGGSAYILADLFERLGASAENPLGVQVSGPVFGVTLILAFFAYARLDEHAIVDATSEHPQEKPA
jgi:GPH family glycoside/pentoside/hexuronide:cation symporter